MCFVVFVAKVWRDRVNMPCVELARHMEEFTNSTTKISFEMKKRLRQRQRQYDARSSTVTGRGYS